MHFRFTIRAALLAVGVLLCSLARGPAAEPVAPAPSEASPTPRQVRQAVERGLVFLKEDAVKWRKERQCASCHHGVMTVWALEEAKGQGYPVEGEALKDMVKWTKEQRLAAIDQPRDSRPGYNLVSLPALYLALLAQASPKQDAVSREELGRIADHVARHQEADGFWSVPPPRNGPPPVFESREVLTLLAYLALEPGVPADPKLASPARAARAQAADWLAKAEATKSTQVLALRLLVDVRAGTPAKQMQPGIDRLLGRQNTDGGWGQDKDLASDAYATGQALYALGLAGVPGDRAEVRRGVSFLVASQKQDGSWPMTSRAQPGEKPFTNPVPITYFGSAWASLGLMRSVTR
jgi:hypothetical protein